MRRRSSTGAMSRGRGDSAIRPNAFTAARRVVSLCSLSRRPCSHANPARYSYSWVSHFILPSTRLARIIVQRIPYLAA